MLATWPIDHLVCGNYVGLNLDCESICDAPGGDTLLAQGIYLTDYTGTPWLISIFTDCSVASRVVVMVQWLAHPTSNQGDAGSIPTHGTYVFHSKRISQW